MIYNGNLNASKLKIAIIVSRFNSMITQKLLDGAIDCLIRHEAKDTNIDTFWVSGAFEIPFMCRKAAYSNKYDAIIALGCVIRGSTPHFDYVANESAKGVASLNLSQDTPVIYGILTTESIDQAIERAGTKSGNRGYDAALSAIEMANLAKQF